MSSLEVAAALLKHRQRAGQNEGGSAHFTPAMLDTTLVFTQIDTITIVVYGRLADWTVRLTLNVSFSNLQVFSSGQFLQGKSHRPAMDYPRSGSLSSYIRSVQVSYPFQGSRQIRPREANKAAGFAVSGHARQLNDQQWLPRPFDWGTPNVRVQKVKKITARSSLSAGPLKNSQATGVSLAGSGLLARSTGSPLQDPRVRPRNMTYRRQLNARKFALQAGFESSGRDSAAARQERPARLKTHCSQDLASVDSDDGMSASDTFLSPHTMWMLRRWKAKALGLQAVSCPIPLAPLRHTQQQVVKATLKSYESSHQTRIAAAMALRRMGAAEQLPNTNQACLLHAQATSASQQSPGSTQVTQQNAEQRRNSMTNLSARAVVDAMRPLSARSPRPGQSPPHDVQRMAHRASSAIEARESLMTSHKASLRLCMLGNTMPGSRVGAQELVMASPRLTGIAETKRQEQKTGTRTDSPNYKAPLFPSVRTHEEVDGDSDSTHGLESPAAGSNHEHTSLGSQPLPATTQVTKPSMRTATYSDGIKELQARLHTAPDAVGTPQPEQRKQSLHVAIPEVHSNPLQSVKSTGAVSGKAASVLGSAIRALQRSSPADAGDADSDSSSLSGFSESESD